MAHDERRKEIVEEQSDDDIPIAQFKRKVGKVAQHPRGRGDTNPPPAPHHSTEQSRRARTKHAHKPDSHYDDYLDISLDTLENFILRPQKPPCAGLFGWRTTPKALMTSIHWGMMTPLSIKRNSTQTLGFDSSLMHIVWVSYLVQSQYHCWHEIYLLGTFEVT